MLDKLRFVNFKYLRIENTQYLFKYHLLEVAIYLFFLVNYNM